MNAPEQLPLPTPTPTGLVSPGGLTCASEAGPCPVFLVGADESLLGSFGVGLLLMVVLLTALLTAQLRRS